MRFVADDPPAKLVVHLAAAYEHSAGDLRQVMRALLNHPAFWRAWWAKVKSPFELVVSSLRALDAELSDTEAVMAWVRRMGHSPYAYAVPTGYPDRAFFWTGVGSMKDRINFAFALTGSRIRGVTFDLAALVSGEQGLPESRQQALAVLFPRMLPQRDSRYTLPWVGEEESPAAAARDPIVQQEQALRKAAYGEAPQGLLRARAREMFDAVDILSPAELDTYRREHGRFYPKTKLGQSLLQIAYLIRKGVGLEIAFAESDSWDTHVAQGTGQGAFASRAGDLAQSIAAFWNDVEDFHDDVVVLTMTEFGRTVAENGSRGTDHGHGSCLFVLGNLVDGGKVYGTVPSLVPEFLFEGRDLPVTTDFRAVFAEVSGKLFGITWSS